MSATTSTVPLTEIIQSSPVPMLVVDGTYEIQIANTEWISAIGAESFEDISGMSAMEFIPQHELKASTQRLDTVFHEEESVAAREFELQTLDGKKRYARGSITPASLSESDDAALIILELDQQREKIERLHEVAVKMTECDSVERIYELMVEAGEDVLELDKCVVDSVEDGILNVEAVSQSVSEDEIFEEPVDSESAGIAGKAYRTGETILDEQEDPPEAHPESEFSSSFTVPIADYGVFQAASTDVMSFNRSDIELVEVLAEHVEAELDRFEHETELERRQQELENQRDQIKKLHSVGVKLAAIESRNQIYELIVEAAEEILDLDMCAVDSVEDGRLVTQAISRELTEYEEPLVNSPDAGIAGKAYRENESYVTKDLHAQTDADPEGEYRSGITVPIANYGVFQAVANDVGAFNDTDLELVELLAEHASEALRRLDYETELKQQRHELDLLRQVFSRVFRHNVRNELTIIQGNAEMIMTTATDESVAHSAEIVKEATNRLIDHTEKAREVEEVVQETEETQTGSLTRMVSTAVADLKRDYSASEIIEDVDDVDVSAIIHIEKAISNAVENALEHNQKPVHVTITSEVKDDEVLLAIEDDGEGIDESELRVIESETETDLTHGSGVGLWLMKWLVEKSGGSISLANIESGVRVEIYLPLA